MILGFRNAGTANVFNGLDTKASRATCPENILRVARRKLDQINQAIQLRDLSAPPGNRLEPLIGNRLGQHSIRINEQFRICFTWTQNGAIDVEITDYH
jgi:toxin HigB-1